MRHQRIMLWVMAMLAVTGSADAGDVADGGGATGLHLLVAVAISYLGFVWYCGDSEARGYPRSPWLSVAGAAFTLATITNNLLRRPRHGEPGRALLAYAACLAGAAFAVWVGMAVRIGLACA